MEGLRRIFTPLGFKKFDEGLSCGEMGQVGCLLALPDRDRAGPPSEAMLGFRNVEGQSWERRV
eukprot:scaffold224886_cov17-Prasinocladus_malaysianus.AAC.1